MKTITVKVKSKELQVTNKVKTYYYTKARRFKTKLHKIIVDNVKLGGIQSQINNIMTKVNGYAYKYSVNNESGPLCQ